MPSRELTLTNDPAELPKAIAAIEEMAEPAGLSGPPLMQLVLAVDELITNAMTHAFTGGASAIQVGIELDSAGLMTVEIIDDGEAFDPLSAPEPDLDVDLDERQIGGLGIHLARQVVDQLAYARRDGRNRLEIKKSLRADA